MLVAVAGNVHFEMRFPSVRPGREVISATLLLLQYVSGSEANFQSFGLIFVLLWSTGGRRSFPVHGLGVLQSVIPPLEGGRTGLASEESECDANG